ncbi:MAG TPA: hypothetical protein VNK23_00850 [Candidatus Dormibacteraeota bacterium]|nr:hypothetical protein [Candidatus Dormibacteraeota bacterium]
MSLNINMFTPEQRPDQGSSATGAAAVSHSNLPGTIECPNCGGSVAPIETRTGWQICPFCEQRLQIHTWPVVRQSAIAAEAMPEQATCFFHPEKAYLACCQRCGRFVCALCDLQLGAEHVCPTCFERGRADGGLSDGKAEWRHRDVLYDSIALAIGWAWIIVWPAFVAALPATIVLHVKYRKAPREYLIPRSGWRFWMAYVGLAWLPLLIGGSLLILRFNLRRH